MRKVCLWVQAEWAQMSRLTQAWEAHFSPSPPCPKALVQPQEGTKVLRASARALGQEEPDSASSWADGSRPWVFLEITLGSLGQAWPYVPRVRPRPIVI